MSLATVQPIGDCEEESGSQGGSVAENLLERRPAMVTEPNQKYLLRWEALERALYHAEERDLPLETL